MIFNVDAAEDSRITLECGGEVISAELYSRRGLDLLNSLLLKVAAEHRVMYEPTWLGRPIVQFANDIVAMQEIIWRVKPDFVIETGVAHGGSLALSASILQLIGHGRVIGIDIDIRAHNRQALDEHPLRSRIDLIEGSSIDSGVVAQVKELVADASSVMVVLDSNHTAAHVRAEMDAYAPMVTSGSYLVAHDGAQAWVSDIPRGKTGWKDDHPLMAIDGFLSDNPNFIIDDNCTRFGVTSSPRGYLKRK